MVLAGFLPAMIAYRRPRLRTALRPTRWAPVFVYLLVLATVVCGPAVADTGMPVACGQLPRPQDSIWLINTRHTGCSFSVGSAGSAGAGAAAGLRYYRFEPPDGTGLAHWRPTDGAAFLRDQMPGGTTLFFVHGNWVSQAEAYQRGLAFYLALVQHAEADRPLRFVTWSWPTARLRGLVKDARIKAQRTELAGYQLAWLVDQMDAEGPIAMVGFSFGARVITGALHVLGGGQLDQMASPVRPATDRGKIRTVLMTAALDDDWLLPGHGHGFALSQVDRMLLLNNSSDPALKWYHMIDRCRRPSALGRWGIAWPGMLGADAQKVDQCDVCCLLGREHSFQSYLNCPDLMRQTWSYLSSDPLLVGNLPGRTDRSVE
ncbi:MAG: hypothetical protein A2W31_01300 [Planctomycetes bacterium RBG_16_64_10]|nr:MAG: hypothetical protein A2W31_01300 [Planctomycetes bacterium RBG_16_64_10]